MKLLFSCSFVAHFTLHHYIVTTFHAIKYSEKCIFLKDRIVMVCVQVGKEFTDMRQNERRTEFIRVGDTIRTSRWLKG